MSKGFFALIFVLGLAASAAAQAPRPADVQQQIRARQRMSTMEGVLERAVGNGADNLLRQIETVTPELPTLTGIPQVRGFRLAGYGLFFDVGVPGLRPPVSWQLRSFSSDAFAGGPLLAQVRALVEVADAEIRALDRDRAVDPRYQARLQSLQLVTRQLLDLERAARAATPVRRQALVSAASTGAAAPTPPVAPVAPDLLDDPGVAYTREIKNALIDAMLESSGPLTIADDEWLTVAARDNLPRDPLVPGDLTDFTTMVLRIKGSDLSALHARRITLEEARKLVQGSDQ